MKLYEIIAKGRKAKGLSLRDLEEITGISNPLLSQIETGYVKEPGFRKVVKISRALDIPLARLAASE